ncbi:MAG: DUF4192 domain-containing protein [Actinomycetes bacterium]
MTSPSTESLRLAGPDQLVAALPFLVGFVPEQSLVLLAVDRVGPRARVVGSARVDLGPSAAGSLRGFVGQAAARGAGAMYAVVYDDDVAQFSDRVRHDGLIEALRELVEAPGLALVDVLAVRTEVNEWRWWSLLCDDPRCCSPVGRTVARGSEVEAEAVGRGLVALPSRSALTSELSVDPALEARVADALPRWLDQARRDDRWRRCEVRSIDAAIAAVASEPAGVAIDHSIDLWAQQLVAVTDLVVRDLVIVQSRSIDVEAATTHWGRLVRAAPVFVRAPAATLLAIAHLQRGEGARANVAVDVALAADPNYAMAGMLAMALSTPAVTTDELLAALHEAHRVERRRVMPGSDGFLDK